jgi:hypothetical protein
MGIISVILDFFPDDFKQELLNDIVDFVANQAKKVVGDEVAKKLVHSLLKRRLIKLSIRR